MGEQMVPLRKASGGTTVAGFTWERDGDVVEVPYSVAVELLAIPGAGFSVADRPAPQDPPGAPAQDPPGGGAGGEPGADAGAAPAAGAKAPAAKRAGARPSPRR